MAEQPSYEQLQKKVEQLESIIANYEKSEVNYRSVFKHLLYEVHIWELVRDDQGQIKTWRLLDANLSALKSWNKSLSDIKGLTTDEIFKVNATEQFMPIVEKIFDEKKPYIWENYFPGTDQTLLMISVPLDDVFISSGLDISDLKKTEKELKETVLQLTESIRAGKVGLWDWDLQTNKVHFSREWKQQIGYEDHEISDDYHEWESRVHPEDLAATSKHLNQSIESGAQDYEVEFRFQHKDGSYRWILALASVILNDQGMPIRMLGSHTDITERKRMESALNQAQKMEALGTLAGGIAHDFNNLLAPILGYAELLKLTIKPESKEFNFISRIEESADRAKNLVEKILIINRASSVKKEVLSLEKILGEVLTVVESSLPKSITIRSIIEPELPNICADSSEIYQVILNLVTNAVQAMPDGGQLDVKLSEVVGNAISEGQQGGEQDWLCLEVKDSGNGIDDETLTYIYDPFFTTKRKGEQRGTGLGLAIVASVIEHNAGKIEVESQLGQGSTFRVYLPAVGIVPVSQACEREIDYNPKKEHILLVDDEKNLCELGEAILHRLGYQVTSYTDSREALSEFKLQPDKYDLVISDFSMPKLTGPAMLKEMKTIRQDIPILLLTGYSDLVAPEKIASLGCDGVVAKPYHIVNLSQTISQTLENSKA